MMKLIVQALYMKYHLDYDECKVYFDQLLQQYPRNIYIMKHAAECYAICSMSRQSISVYVQLRAVDATYTKGLDMFGYVLYTMGNEADLNKLTTEVMTHIDYSHRCHNQNLNQGSPRPEGWLLAAMLSALKNESEKVVYFLDKV